MSTVEIVLADVLGVAVACEVVFRPEQTPLIDGSTLTVSGSRSVMLDEFGRGSVDLAPGRYSVRFAGVGRNGDVLEVVVPDDGGVYPLTGLIGGGASVVLSGAVGLLRDSNLTDVGDAVAAFDAVKQSASVAKAGVVRLATQGEVDAGVAGDVVVTPGTLAGAARWGAISVGDIADGGAVGKGVLRAVTGAEGRSALGLENVDNTRDSAKPVSAAVQGALDSKVNDSALATVAKTGSYGDLSGRPAFGSMAFQNAGGVAVTGGSVRVGNRGLGVADSDGSHTLVISPQGNLTAERTLGLNVADGDRVLSVLGDVVLNGGAHNGVNTGDQTIVLSGAVTGSGSGAITTALASGVVGNVALAAMPAGTLKGNAGGLAGGPGDLTAGQVKGLLAISAGDVSGLAVSATVDATNAANLSVGTVPGGRMPAFTGDVTSSAGSLSLTVGVGTVTDAKAALAAKPMCRVVAVGNLTLSGVQTVDGVSLSAGNLVLATAQTTGSQNGPWVVGASAWQRPVWYPSGGSAQVMSGACFLIQEGTSYSGSLWSISTTSGVVIDTNAVSFFQVKVALGTSGLSGVLPAAQFPALTGAVVTTAGSLATSLGANVVSNANFATVAYSTFKGRKSVGTGNVEDLTLTDVQNLIFSNGPLAGLRNLVINGGFGVNQRGGGTVSSGGYCLDRWYILTESGSVTVAQQADQENGSPRSIRLTQPDATAKRMGLAQVVEGELAKALRGVGVMFSCRVRVSVSVVVRYALLEWSGTLDSVTRNVVASWTSTTFSAGNFFITPSLNVLKTGTVTPTANTWTTISDSASVGVNCNNLVLFFWTEGAFASSANLDFGRVQLERAFSSTPFEVRHPATELALCQRYFYQLKSDVVVAGYGLTTAAYAQPLQFPVEMRVVPTVTSSFGASQDSSAGTKSVTGVSQNGCQLSLLSTVTGGSYVRTTYLAGNSASAEL